MMMLTMVVAKDKLPLFAKANGILVMQQAGDFADDVKSDVLEIHCYPVSNAEDFNWVYYDDDGTSFNYESGMFARRTLYLSGREKKFVMSDKEGDFKSAFNFIHIYIHGMNDDEFRPVMNEKEFEVLKTDYRFVQPVSSFDPQGKFRDESKTVRDLKYVRLPFSDKTIELNW
jgi:alpha-glucosidase